MPAKPTKLFVLDTNVILHDSGCLSSFEENNVAIPITVLEELDRFKRGHEDINFHARSFLRALDDLTGDLLSNGGATIGEGLGCVRVVIGGDIDDRVRSAFLADSPDHRILNTTLRLSEGEPDTRVVLVSKDTNLRMKAKSLGIPAQDYRKDKIESFDKLYTGKRIVEDTPPGFIDGFYSDEQSVPAASIEIDPAPVANESFIFRNGSTCSRGWRSTTPTGFRPGMQSSRSRSTCS